MNTKRRRIVAAAVLFLVAAPVLAQTAEAPVAPGLWKTTLAQQGRVEEGKVVRVELFFEEPAEDNAAAALDLTVVGFGVSSLDPRLTPMRRVRYLRAGLYQDGQLQGESRTYRVLVNPFSYRVFVFTAGGADTLQTFLVESGCIVTPDGTISVDAVGPVAFPG